MSSLQKDFLQKSHVKSPKRACRTRLPPKVKRKHPLLWDTVAGHSCGTLLRDTLVRHSCGTLLRDTLVGHSCGTLIWDTLAGHSCGTQHPFTRQSHCDSDIHLYHNSHPHNSLHLPRFHTSKPTQSTAPATKSGNIISCQLQQNLHHTTRLE